MLKFHQLYLAIGIIGRWNKLLNTFVLQDNKFQNILYIEIINSYIYILCDVRFLIIFNTSICNIYNIDTESLIAVANVLEICTYFFFARVPQETNDNLLQEMPIKHYLH